VLISLPSEGLDLGCDDDLDELSQQIKRANEYPDEQFKVNGTTIVDETRLGEHVLPYEYLVAEPSERRYFQPRSWRGWGPSLRRSRSPPMIEPSSRASDNVNRHHRQHGREEMFLKAKLSTSAERWEVLSKHIHLICFSIAVDDEVIAFLSSLPNLTSLEVVGLPLVSRARSPWYPDGQPPARLPLEIKYPHLKNLKLRGYFPAAFVRSVCSSAPGITHLNLGLLASMRDDKPFRDTLLRREDEDYSDGPQYDTEPEDEEVVPWALHSPLWLYPEILGPLTLPKLTHLNITRPFRGSGYDYWSDSFEFIPEDLERAQVKEWASFLRTNSTTLKEVIFDYRVPQEAGDTVGDGGAVPERVKQLDSPGYLIFSHLILGLLLKEREHFPNVQRLAFRGMWLLETSLDEEGMDLEGEREEGQDNQSLLRKTFPNCEIEFHQSPYPIYVYAGWVYQDWPDSYHEAMQDVGDGLLYESSYYHDYVRRFGREWKVAE
jgi:hypothetical protein